MQALKTTGARRTPFSLGGVLHPAVPQLAEDVPSQQEAGVEAGNSDLPALIYR